MKAGYLTSLAILLSSLLITYTSVNAQKVAGGSGFSLIICDDGTVMACGTNWDGQLGDGTYLEKSTPVQVSGLADIIAVSCGIGHSMALRSDGTVWTWGLNGAGQLGDGTNTDRLTPVQVSGLTGVIQISAGSNHSMAVKSDGTLWTWGAGSEGQLGTGGTAFEKTPVQAIGLPSMAAATGGIFHSQGLATDGTAWGWGRNTSGQLGVGSCCMDEPTPKQVTSLSNVMAIGAGNSHSMFLLTDGTVWVSGKNYNGQLGDGNGGYFSTNKSTPVKTDTLFDIIAIAETTTDHGIALRQDGTVWAWGMNDQGQLGIGTTTDQMSPVQIGSLSNIGYINGGYRHSLFVRGVGTVLATGVNEYGALGDGTTTDRLFPVSMSLTCTPATDINGEKNSNHSVEIFPNPFMYEATISISGLDSYEDVTFTLYDLTGSEMLKIEDIESEKTRMRTGNLAKGMYIYRLNDQKGILNTGKIIVN